MTKYKLLQIKMPINEFEAAIKWKEKQKITWRDVINAVVQTSLLKETTIKLIANKLGEKKK